MKHSTGLRPWLSRLFLIAGLLAGVGLFGQAADAGADTFYRFGKQKIAVEVAKDEVALVAARGKLLAPAEQVRALAQASRAQVVQQLGRFAVLQMADAAGAAAGPALQALSVQAGAQAVQPVFKQGGRRLVSTGEILVHFAEGADAATRDALVAKYGLTEVSAPSASVFVYAIDDAQAVLTIANAIADSAGVEAAYPNLIDTSLKPMGFVVNDPLFPDQWHLRNTGQGGGLRGADANVRSIWNTYTGTHREVICVVDDFVEYWHEDLKANVFTRYYKDYLGLGFGNGVHGTEVAGVAAARGGNGIGVTGMAPGAAIVNHQIFLDAGSTGLNYEDQADSQTRGNQLFDIYNNSWGPSNTFATNVPAAPIVQAALRDGARTGRGGLGSIFLFAGGNYGDSSNTNYSGFTNSPYTMSIAASTNFGTRAAYSNPGATILVNAPSNGGSLGIVTTDRMDSFGDEPGNYTYEFGGTSSATPLVAGVVALMLQANPNLTWQDVKHILLSTAYENSPLDGSWQHDTEKFSYSHDHGFGRVDADKAVRTAASFISTGPRQFRSVTLINDQFRYMFNGETHILEFDFSLEPNLFIEHVEVVVNLDLWNDTRITLISPTGRESVLAEPHTVFAEPLSYWTFGSIAHYGEPTKGVWQVKFENGTSQAALDFVKVGFLGRTDADNLGFGDGLPDDWERTFFGTNANLDTIQPSGPGSDPNGDGKTNWQHFVDGTDPANRNIVVYRLEQLTTARGTADEKSVAERRNGILISDQGNADLRAILYYRNEDGQQVFHEEYWGTVNASGLNPFPTMTEYQPAVQKFLAQADKDEHELIVAADYFDTIPVAEQLVADNWKFRILLGRGVTSGVRFGLGRGTIATKMSGLYLESQSQTGLIKYGKLNARLDTARTLEANKPSITPDNVADEVKTILTNPPYDFYEQKLTLTLANPTPAEGTTTIATLTRNTTILRPLTVTLTNPDNTEISLPKQVTIPAGSASTTFVVTALLDGAGDGDRTLTFRATVDDHTPALATVTVVDID